MNKYLEKIANWHEVEPGLHYNYHTGHYNISPEKKHEMNQHLDNKHMAMGAKVFGGLGAVTAGGLGMAVGERSVFGAPRNLTHRFARGGKGALIGGVLGAGLGAALAHGGNSQVHADPRNSRLQSAIAHKVGDYQRTTEYQLLNKGN